MAQLQSTSITGSLIVTGGITGSISGSIVSPGSTTQVLYNNGGVVAGASGLVYSGSYVGIGTTSPVYPLQINSTVAGGGMMSLLNTSDVESSISYRISNGGTSTGWVTGNYNNDFFMYSYTLGGQAMTLKPSGNVGIGTSSPSSKLTVIGTIRANGSGGQVDADPTSGAFRFYDGSTFRGGFGTDAWATSGNASDLTTYLNGGSYYIYSTNTSTKIFTALAGGNIGIGTTSPGYKLEVNGTLGVTSTSRLIGNATVGSDTVQWSLAGVANGGAIWQKSHSGAGGFDDRYLRLGNVDNNGTPNYVLTIINSNVGIGTTNPGYTLQVSGEIVNSTSVGSTGDPGIALGNGHRLGFDQSGTRSWTIKATGGNLVVNSGDGNGNFNTSMDSILRNAFIGVISAYGTNYASFSHTSRAGAGEYSFLSGNAGETYINAKTSNSIYFRVNNIDKVIINNDGNLGIGTTTPEAKLQVSGSISGSSINFGQNDLNFYEENTWTPAIETVNNDIGTVNYNGEPIASYTRIGNVVHTWFNVDISSIGGVGTGTGKITGLPYTAASNGAPFTATILNGSVIQNGAAGEQLKGYIDQGSDFITLYLYDSGTGGYGPSADARWQTSGGIISGHVSYQV